MQRNLFRFFGKPSPGPSHVEVTAEEGLRHQQRQEEMPQSGISSEDIAQQQAPMQQALLFQWGVPEIPSS